MSDPDDFERSKRLNASQMAADKDLLDSALDVLVRADRYHYTYQWSWLGLPIIQLPSDVMALQEIVWENRPTLIIETGVARGGSIIFYASLMQLLGAGRVIGIELELRDYNRHAINSHPLSHRIALVEGSSTSPEIYAAVCKLVKPEDHIMVVLDSDHTHEHVLRELRLYAPLVSLGQFLVVADTVVEDIPSQVHRPRPWGPGNNPKTALRAFLEENDDFELDPYVNAKLLQTSSPQGYLRRRK